MMAEKKDTPIPGQADSVKGVPSKDFLRELIHHVVSDLVESKSIFDASKREIYATKFDVTVTYHSERSNTASRSRDVVQTLNQESEPASSERHLHTSKITKSDSCSPLSENGSKDETNDAVESSSLPLQTWLRILATDDTRENVKVNSLRCEAAKDFQTNDMIAKLDGKVIDVESGYEKFKCYEAGLAGIVIFNLGESFEYKWFNAEENLSGPLGQIIHSRLSANADINVLNISGEAVPIIYATKIIKKTELIFLSKRKIAALNRDFVTWYENKTVSSPRTRRVPNLGKKLENAYDWHLRICTQNGLEKKFVSKEVGYGVFASKFFHQKEFISEYKGELLDNEEAKRRFDRYPTELGSYMFYLGPKKLNKWIDATSEQNCLGRFVNHSKKKPNCKAICKMVDGIPRLFLVALTDIFPGTEILYNYNEKNKDFPFLKK